MTEPRAPSELAVKIAEKLVANGFLLERDVRECKIVNVIDSAGLAALVEENKRLREALKQVAIVDQDERPLHGLDWEQPFDWRRRSMKQEELARAALEHP